MTQTKEELSYQAGYYRACKSEGCHAPLRYLKDDGFMALPAVDVDPESYQEGFESGLKACIKHQNRGKQ